MKSLLVVCLSLSMAVQPLLAQSGTQPPSAMPGYSVPPSADRYHGILRPYSRRTTTQPSFENSSRIRGLIRAGNIYLALPDAIALAIENNLDIELLRYALPIAQTETLRARGGGLTRGLYFTLGQPPAGVGGPQSPLITQAATQSTPGTNVASNALELGVLAEPQTNLSLFGTVPISNGSPIPSFDPSLFANYNWMH